MKIKKDARYYSKIGRKGGKKTFAIYGAKHYKRLAEKRWSQTRSLKDNKKQTIK